MNAGYIVEMAARHHLSLLGGFDFRSGGRAVGLRSKKAQALLTYLAVEKTTPHTREHLASLLWGEMDDEHARHNLRQALSRIRQCCGDILVARGQLVEIDRDACATDVADFLTSSESLNADALAACLDRYEGDLLDGIHVKAPAFENWLRDARERLRRTACSIIDRLADLLLAEGRTAAAEEAFRRRLRMDPACENAHRGLMDLFAGTGRRSEAIRQYQLCVEVLRRDLEVDPEPKTVATYERIRAAAELAPPPVEAIEPSDAGPVVAILPFDNLSGADDLYFADGITEDLTTALSRFHDLQVIARVSSFNYRGHDVPDAEVAAALGAAFLVRGSVRRAGATARINVQLLDTKRGRMVWAEQYDRELTDVFEVQNEIISMLVSSLVGKVESARLSEARSAPVERLESYDLLLRGKYHHHLFTAEDCQTCIDLFDLAIERDPGYAVAHAWLSCGLGQAMVHRLGDHAELVDRSEAAAMRGLELDENESECHRVLAQVSLLRGNVRRALLHQERALFLNPNDDRSICAMGEILTFAGRPEEGERWVRKSLKLNPYHPQRYWSHLARALFYQRRFADAMELLDRIGRPRGDDMAYAVAAAGQNGDREAVRRSVAALRLSLPDFDAAAFVETQPLERAEDRALVLDALEAAL